MILQISNLGKTFNRPITRQSLAQSFSKRNRNRMTIEAIKDFSATLNRAEIASLKGPNGTGKSTLLKIIAGIYKQSQGSYNVYGRIMPLLTHAPTMYYNLEIHKNIRHFLNLHKVSSKNLNDICEQILDTVKLANKADYLLFQLSRGQLSALSLICGLSINKDLYLIDELLDPLDDQYRIIVADKLKSIKQNNCSALVVTHDTKIDQILGSTLWTL